MMHVFEGVFFYGMLFNLHIINNFPLVAMDGNCAKETYYDNTSLYTSYLYNIRFNKHK